MCRRRTEYRVQSMYMYMYMYIYNMRMHHDAKQMATRGHTGPSAQRLSLWNDLMETPYAHTKFD